MALATPGFPSTKADWYKEPWYRDPKNLFLDYINDPAYVDPEKPIIKEWNRIFGQ